MKPRIHFLAPVPDTFPSGGNIYNEALLKALIEKGYTCTIGPEEDSKADITLFDSIFYPEEISQEPDRSQKYFLAHMLPASIPDPNDWIGAIVTGESSRQGLLKAGWLEKKVLLLEPASEAILSIPQRRKSPLTVAWIANLLPNKQILPFLKNLKPDMPFKIQLAGSAEMDLAYAKACKEEINRLNGQVEFTGSQNRFQIRRLLKKSNLFLSTSEFESFGMAIQEARLHALPVLSYKSGSGAHAPLSLESFSSFDRIIKRLEELATDQSQMQQLLDLAWMDRTEYAKLVPSWNQQADKLIRFLLEFRRGNA